MNTGNAAEYCRQKAAAMGTSFYYSTLYCSAEIKCDLFALHAFANQLAEVITDCSDPGVARMKLGWWVEEVGRMIRGQARHPVTLELARVRDRFPDTDAVIMQLIRQHDLQINPEPPQTYADLMAFLGEGPGLLWKLSAQICGCRDPRTPGIISHLGSRFAWFQIMQDTRQQLRSYWPREELTGTVEDDAFYAFQIQRLTQELESGTGKLADVDQANQLPALIMARIITTACAEIARSGYRLQQEKIHLTPLRKLWIAWRTYRRHK